MGIKIVSDSSADIRTLSSVDFASVPLKIIAGEREFVDAEGLDVRSMMDFLASYNEKSGTSCPNTAEYLEAFGDAEEIFCVTITRNLSGSYTAAMAAAAQYEKDYPGRRVYVVDTLSAGAECGLIVEKIRELILEGNSFDEIKAKIVEYQSKTRLIFALQSLHNLAANGRVSPLAAKISSVLGIRVVGKASSEGTLEVTDKVIGAQKAAITIFKNMLAEGYCGKKVIINGAGASDFIAFVKKCIHSKFPNAEITEGETKGLCSFYAERGGVMIGFELG